MNSELLSKAAFYCSCAEHCSAEVIEKLKQWGAEENETDPIVKYLIKENYIDEARYTKAFVNDKLRFAKWGKVKIAYMLAKKKIDKRVVDDAIDEIDEDLYLDVLESLLKSKIKSLRSVEPQQLNLMLYRYAASRGFETSEISKVLERMK